MSGTETPVVSDAPARPSSAARARGCLLGLACGDDADTTAAVCGQLAGASYGAGGIPAQWLDRLVLRDTIEAWAERLLQSKPG